MDLTQRYQQIKDTVMMIKNGRRDTEYEDDAWMRTVSWLMNNQFGTIIEI